MLRRVEADPVQPGIERRLSAKAIEGAIGADESFLRDVRSIAVADQSTDQLHDLVLVFAHEQFERALVTRLRADNELFVGNGIDHALMRFSRGRKTLHSQPRNSSKTRFSSGQRRTQTLAYQKRLERRAQNNT